MKSLLGIVILGLIGMQQARGEERPCGKHADWACAATVVGGYSGNIYGLYELNRTHPRSVSRDIFYPGEAIYSSRAARPLSPEAITSSLQEGDHVTITFTTTDRARIDQRIRDINTGLAEAQRVRDRAQLMMRNFPSSPNVVRENTEVVARAERAASELRAELKTIQGTQGPVKLKMRVAGPDSMGQVHGVLTTLNQSGSVQVLEVNRMSGIEARNRLRGKILGAAGFVTGMFAFEELAVGYVSEKLRSLVNSPSTFAPAMQEAPIGK